MDWRRGFFHGPKLTSARFGRDPGIELVDVASEVLEHAGLILLRRAQCCIHARFRQQFERVWLRCWQRGY